MGISFLNKATMPGVTVQPLLTAGDVSAVTGTPTEATFTDGGIDYKAYIFKGSGTITFSANGLCDVLVVAGGAGAGYGDSPVAPGGGGAGGAMYYQNYSVTIGTKTATVGASGTNSSLFDLIIQTGGNIASGIGGTGNINGQYGNGTGQNLGVGGNNGGLGSTQPRGGGGGGAGGVGATGAASGNGGIGLITTIIPTATATSASIGQVSGGNVYFAGGGGGADARSGQPSGVGGLGGGGNGGTRYGAAPTSGAANSGSGGGASSNASSASGGSGVVIVRVLA